MDHIGIITIPDYNNYGNRLQNYAVKHIFENMGFKVSSLELNDPNFEKYKERKYKLLLKKSRLLPVVFLYEMLTGGYKKAKRDQCFEKFTLEYLNVDYEPVFNENIKKKLLNKYSYFVLGSDQIWHPHVNNTPFLYFAKFSPQNRIIYFAPSFGVNDLPQNYIDIVRDGINDAECISVREKSGQKIIKDVIGKDAELLIDPTLMLDSSEWEKISKKPSKFPSHKYILKCFLGHVNDEYEGTIKKISDKLGKRIFTIADKTKSYGYTTGPQEFIYCIMNSDFVVTDSFHTVVFAILFNKPFVVFSRLDENGKSAGLDSRIDDLIANLNLTDRKYSESLCTNLEYCDFSSVPYFISSERKRVEEYLNKCLGTSQEHN